MDDTLQKGPIIAVLLAGGIFLALIVFALLLAASAVGSIGGSNNSETTVSCDNLRGVPGVYPDYFCGGGKKYKIDPAVVAAIHWTENRRFVDDPINYRWPCSPAGACGPSQFIASTWDSYGVDGPKLNDGDGGGDNKKDREQSLSDGLYASARYLAAIGGKSAQNPSEADVRKIAGEYNGGPSCPCPGDSENGPYMQMVVDEWKKLRGES